MLTQLKHQFDVVSELSDLSKYELVILPDAVEVGQDLSKKLKAYLKAGGSLLVSGTSGLNPQGTESALPELGIKPAGMSPYQTTYIRFGKEISQGVPAADHVMYEKGVRVAPSRGTKVVAQVVEPYFDRTWEHFSSHCQTPYAKVSRYPAATLNGRVGYISFPVFAAFSKHGNYPYRLLVQNLIEQLMPDQLLDIDAPTSTETSVMRQGKRTIVHLLQYCPSAGRMGWISSKTSCRSTMCRCRSLCRRSPRGSTWLPIRKRWSSATRAADAPSWFLSGWPRHDRL